jgi:hypothetical protein
MGDNMVDWFAGCLVRWFCSLQCGSFIQKKERERAADGPVQLSKVCYLLCIFLTACVMFVILMHLLFF